MQHNRQHKRMNACPSNYIMDWWLLYVSTPHVTHWFWLNTVPFTKHGLCTHATRQKDKLFTYHVVLCLVPGLFLPLRLPQQSDTTFIQESVFVAIQCRRLPQYPQGSSCQVTDIFNQFQPDLDFLTYFSYKSPTSNFRQNRADTDGYRDRRTGMKKLIGAFRDYTNRPNNPRVLALQLHKGLVYVKFALVATSSHGDGCPRRTA